MGFRVAICAILLTLAPAAGAVTEGYAEHDEQVRAILGGVSWDAPQVVEVLLEDHNYHPSDIVLPLNKPVLLRLKNIGNVVHDMVGGSIFQAILVKSVGTTAGRIVTPYIQSVLIRAKQHTDILLLPIKAGRYTFYCSIAGHRESGMEGSITIR
jgi:uncharacterized cupredoxin-like copper-binding protein